jgi:hypothetical protein
VYRRSASFCLIVLGFCGATLAQDAATTSPAVHGFPHVKVDVAARQIRVDCVALGVDAALEFFCVTNGTNEHESVLKTPAKPSHIHAALLMLGLEPGEPVKYSEAAQKWFPPHGPPLNISVEYVRDGKTVSFPAYRLMRNITTKQSMPVTTWIFAGSRVMPDGVYAADVTGYAVSIVNFDLALIDVPELASSANETLLWERNPDTTPPLGTDVTMIIEPTGDRDTMPATRSSEPTTKPLSDVHADQEKVDHLRALWDQKVAPHAGPLREAAQTQYEVVSQLRAEQQRLIDEADRIQRVIDELEKQYQQMTTPRPSSAP